MPEIFNYRHSFGLQDKCLIRIPIIPGFTTREDAKHDAEIKKAKGFEKTEIFEYVIRDYMKK